MKFTIDRIEKNVVVCENENRKTFNLPLEIFPKDVKSGQIYQFDRDIETENERKNTIQNRFDRLKKK